MKTGKKRMRISLVVMISIMMVMSSFAPTCIAFAEDEAGSDGQTVATESAKEETSAPPQQEQKEEPKEEPKQESNEGSDPKANEVSEPEPQQITQETKAEPEQNTQDQNGYTPSVNEEENKESDVEEDPDDAMPAQSFNGSAGGINVRASAGKGVFPKGTKMKVTSVSRSRIISAGEAATGEELSIVDGAAVDITFTKDGREIQPAAGSVNVGLSSRTIAGDVHETVHLSGGKAEIIGGASANSTSFRADHFSIYGIIGGNYEDGVQELARYTYVFKVKGQEVGRQTVIDGEKLTEPASIEDKDLSGWRVDGQSEDIDFSKAISIPETETTDREFVVNAVFSKTYYATFYRDETKNEVLQVKEGKQGDTVTTSDVSGNSPEGWPIAGWMMEGGSAEAPVAEVTFEDGDIELLPIVIKNPVQVTFETGEGTPMAPAFVESGKSLKEPSDPERAGYAFKGWFLDSDCIVEYDFSTKVTVPLTLYAKWEAKKTSYKVVEWKQNANDDDYSFVQIQTMTGTAGTPATYTPTTYEGFTLNAARSNDTVIIEGDGTTIKNVYYDRKTYTLTFKVYSFPGWETAGEKVFKYQQDTSKFWAEINEEYTDRLWRETKDESSNIFADAKPMPGKNWTLYGRKGDGTSQLIYIDADSSNNKEIRPRYVFGESKWNFSKDYTAPSIPGFTYKNHTGPFMEQGINTGRVYYVRNKYSLHFEENGGPDVADVKGIPYDTNLAGYAPSTYIIGETEKTVNGIRMTFAGWYSDESLQKAFDFSGKMPALEVTVNANSPDEDKSTLVLYAKWIKSEHTVSFDLDGGKYAGSDNIASQAVESGAKITSPDETEMEKAGGYVFSHWANENGDRFSFDTKITRDYDLKAVWNSNNAKMLTVVYDADNGTNAPTDSKKYQAGSTAVIKGQPTAPTDMYFKGWKIGKSNMIIAGGSFPVNVADATNDVITLTAQYDKKPSYPTAVIYNANGGMIKGDNTYTDNSATVNGDYKIIDDEPTLSERTFLGWSRDANATKPTFKPGQTVAAGKEGNVLYAVWKQENNTDPIDDDPINDDPINDDQKKEQVNPIDNNQKKDKVKPAEEDPVNKVIDDADGSGNNGAGTVKAEHNDPDSNNRDSGTARTGDDFMIALYIALMLAAIVTAVVIEARGRIE